MDCNDVKRWIDKIAFEKDFELKKEVKLHLENCSECRKYYEKQKQTASLISNLKNQIPRLNNPDELKSEILSAIKNETPGAKRNILPVLFLTRLLAAATVALFITLGIEQYAILQKLKHLEIQFGKVDQPTMMQNIRLYKSSIVDIDALLSNGEHNLNMKRLSLFFKLKRIENSNFTFYDLKRNIGKNEKNKKLIEEKKQKLNP